MDTLIAVLGMSGIGRLAFKDDGGCCLTSRRDTAGALIHVTLGAGGTGERDDVEILAFGQRVISVWREHHGEVKWWDDDAVRTAYYRSILPDSVVFPLPNASGSESLAFVELFGHGLKLWSEYGWICEYSTFGRPPQQRSATLALLEAGRTDLLQVALREAVHEGRVYAADALLYAEQRGKPLSDDDRLVINQLGASPDSVTTCLDGRGSYQTWRTAIRDLLSAERVADFPSRYDALRDRAWYDGGI